MTAASQHISVTLLWELFLPVLWSDLVKRVQVIGKADKEQTISDNAVRILSIIFPYLYH